VSIRKLTGTVQNYAWGSRTLLGQLQGRPVPTATPEAELWFGAHPQSPSSVDGDSRKLDAYLREQGLDELGPDVVHRFGKLPFLVKLLAIDLPLSIQVHPSRQQALSGFERERARGLSAGDPCANYRDNWPKPELLCPLTDFEALCGFRPVTELIELLTRFGGDCFADAAAVLRKSPHGHGLKEVVAGWLAAEACERARLYDSAFLAYTQAATKADHSSRSAKVLLELAQRYPGDMGVVVAALLQHWLLPAGSGLFVPPGVMHAYLRGFAVEVMATSDNVLRGGLTPKHVDVSEFLALADFNAKPSCPLIPEERGPLESAFVTEGEYFSVSRIVARPHMSYCARQRVGPEMLLCVEGRLDLVAANQEELVLNQSECVWVGANEDVYCVTGAGQGFRVQVGA